MSTNEALKKLDDLVVYMDYWVELRTLEITLKTSYNKMFWSFDDFCNKISKQTGMLMIDEWKRKWPERFKQIT